MSVIESLADNKQLVATGIDEKNIFSELDPDEEKLFAKYFNSIKLGPDDEVYYKETRSSYTINKLKDESVQIRNELAVAEQMGQMDDMNRLAAKLIEIESLIKSTMEG